MGSVKLRFVIFIHILLLLAIVVPGCGRSDITNQVNAIVKSERFSIFEWEVSAIAGAIWDSTRIHESPDRSDVVIAYFDALHDGKAETADGTPLIKLRPRVEKIIQQQTRDVLSDLDIKNPAGNFLGIHFPPMNFELSVPPDLLVTSPRDKIELLKEVRLQPDLTTIRKESIESQAEQLGISAMVTELGGMGTFPSFVSSSASLQEVLNDAAHEWLHQYLAFTPLGFRYVLDLMGISPNYDIVTINETVAGIFGNEVGALVYEKYYSKYKEETEQPEKVSAFDFNAVMRNIRLNVDSLLAAGKIDEAEQYMDNQRDYLQTKGYYIRKLNQAYFAFYGTYASEPTSVSPIGVKINEIRDESSSLKVFIGCVSGISSVEQLGVSCNE
jgi:hypothetical protein